MPLPTLIVTLYECGGCGRLAMHRSPKEHCPDTDRMESQRPIQYARLAEPRWPLRWFRKGASS